MKIPAQYRLTVLAVALAVLALLIGLLPQRFQFPAACFVAFCSFTQQAAALVRARRMPPKAVVFPDGSAAHGIVTSEDGQWHLPARAVTMSDGILYTDAGCFRRHHSRPGVWVCVRDAERFFTFGAPPSRS